MLNARNARLPIASVQTSTPRLYTARLRTYSASRTHSCRGVPLARKCLNRANAASEYAAASPEAVPAKATGTSYEPGNWDYGDEIDADVDGTTQWENWDDDDAMFTDDTHEEAQWTEETYAAEEKYEEEVEAPLERVEIDESSPERIPYHNEMKELSKRGDIEGTSKVLERMAAAGLPPGPCAYHAVAFACVQDGNVDQALATAKNAFMQGVAPLRETYAALVWGYVEAGDIARAEQAMVSMHKAGMDPQLGWRILCKGLFRKRLTAEALDHVDKGIMENWALDATLYAYVMQAYVDAGQVERAQYAFTNMITHGVPPEERHANIMIKGVTKNQGFKTALEYLESIMSLGAENLQPTHASFHSILEGYIESLEQAPNADGEDEEGLANEDEIPEELMRSEGLKPGEEPTLSWALTPDFEDVREEDLRWLHWEGPDIPLSDADYEQHQEILPGSDAANEPPPEPELPVFEEDFLSGNRMNDIKLQDITDTMADLGLDLQPRSQALLLHIAMLQKNRPERIIDGFKSLRKQGGIEHGEYTNSMDAAQIRQVLDFFCDLGRPLQVLLVLQDLTAAGRQLDNEQLMQQTEAQSFLTRWLQTRIALLESHSGVLTEGLALGDGVMYEPENYEGITIGIANCAVDETGVPIPPSKMKVNELRAELEARGSDASGLRFELYNLIKEQRKLLRDIIAQNEVDVKTSLLKKQADRVKSLIAQGLNAAAVRKTIRNDLFDDESEEKMQERNAQEEKDEQFTIPPDYEFVITSRDEQGTVTMRTAHQFSHFDESMKIKIQKWWNIVRPSDVDPAEATARATLSFGYDDSNSLREGVPDDDEEDDDFLQPTIGLSEEHEHDDDGDIDGVGKVDETGDAALDALNDGEREEDDPTELLNAAAGEASIDSDEDDVSAALSVIPDFSDVQNEVIGEGSIVNGGEDELVATLAGATNENAGTAVAFEIVRLAEQVGLVPTPQDQFTLAMANTMEAERVNEAEETGLQIEGQLENATA